MELATFALVGAATMVALLAAYFSVRQGHERLALTASIICLLALMVGTYLTIGNELRLGNKAYAVMALLFGSVFCLIVVSLISSALHRAVELSYEADAKGITLRVTNAGGQFAIFTLLLNITASSLVRATGGTTLRSGDRVEYKPIVLQAGQSAQIRIADIQTGWAGKPHNTRMYTMRQSFLFIVDGEVFATSGSGPPTIPSEALSFDLLILRTPPTLRRNESKMRCWIGEDGRLLFQVDETETRELDRYRLMGTG